MCDLAEVDFFHIVYAINVRPLRGLEDAFEKLSTFL